MSTHDESPSIPPVEDKSLAQVTTPRLERGALKLVDIATSTMANIAPAMSFFFSSALIVQAAGIASPLTIVLAAVAIALLGNTLAEFSRAIPSTGSFITFIGKTFGPVMAVTTTIVIAVGYIIAMASVIAISGGWTQMMLQKYIGINIPWQLLTLIFVAIVFFLMVRGIHLSTRWAGYFFLLEMAVLILVSVIALITNASHLSLAPFNPANMSNGLQGLGLGFPIAVYLFVGWENSAALAEETDDPRRNVPRAIFSSVLLMSLSYLLFSYAMVVAFNYNVKDLSAAQVPFVTAAEKISGILALLAYIAGFTSTMSAMIAGSNSQSRLIFNAAREGLLPSVLATVHRTRRTPWVSFLLFFVIGLAIVYIFGWSIDPVTFFGEISTLGTILIALTYLVSNIALPVYYRRYHPEQFSILKHLILPILGVFAIGFPLWGLIAPGQEAPFNIFPWISLGIIVAGLIYALILTRRDPNLGERVGSIVADRE
ncbi:APC family permease [Dictyobacter kobayashii]|uniref:Amino acid permease n=1 Tax=Dictyobacter kobayashii TaxID=2014872 RepID=A0A402ATI8_9CHLR|nr:APC family permease [Dictyobacter kobayashii]GCE22417.1 amino acid permease [Dictyobacter kobayashii]